MQVIYHGHPASQAAVTAAAIHLDLLPREHLPDIEELEHFLHLNATLADRCTDFPVLMGVDAGDLKVYILGMAGDPRLIARIAFSFAQVYGVSDRELRLVEAGSPVGFWQSTAVWLLDLLRWQRMRTRLTTHLLRGEYIKIVDQVCRMGAQLESAPGHPVALDLRDGLKDNYGEQEGEANIDSQSRRSGDRG